MTLRLRNYWKGANDDALIWTAVPNLGWPFFCAPCRVGDDVPLSWNDSLSTMTARDVNIDKPAECGNAHAQLGRAGRKELVKQAAGIDACRRTCPRWHDMPAKSTKNGNAHPPLGWAGRNGPTCGEAPARDG